MEKGSVHEAKFESAILIRNGDLNRRTKLRIHVAAPVDVPQKSSRGEIPMTFLININDRGYYVRDAYYLRRAGTTRDQLGYR